MHDVEVRSTLCVSFEDVGGEVEAPFVLSHLSEVGAVREEGR